MDVPVKVIPGIGMHVHALVGIAEAKIASKHESCRITSSGF
jgi:hypothetical protein